MSAKSFIINPDKRAQGAEDVRAFILSCKPNKRLVVEVKEYRKTRSNEQNAYLYGVCYQLLCDATGYELKDVAEYLCGEHFGWKTKRVPGKNVVRIPVRTTTTNEDGEYDPLSTVAFAEYIAFVQRFGAQHGVMIPDPDQTHGH